MSGISSTTGLISGINTGAIIDQLLAIEAGPENIIKQHILTLQTQQAAFLDLNSKISALQTAAQKLRLNKLFNTASVASSNTDILTGTASPGTPAGDYSFLVDRVVSTHQLLSRGFVDRSTSGLGLTSLTFESTQARLDSNAQLGDLNGGNGVSRGKLSVTNRAGTTTTIDLSRAATVSDVLAAFNNNTDAKVTASVSGGKLVLTDTSGGSGTLSVSSAPGYTTAASLGIDQQNVAGSTLTGGLISYLGDNTTIQSLNDGNGIRISTDGGTGGYDFKITTQDGSALSVDIGALYDSNGVKTASAVTTVGQLKARIASQTNNKVTVQNTADGAGIRLVDNTTGARTFTVEDRSGSAADLGFVSVKGASATFGGGGADSKTLLAALGSTLTSSLQGGKGVADRDITIQARDGSVFNFSVNNTGSVADLLKSVSDGTGGKVTAALDSNGTSIVFTDTSGGTGNLNVTGAAATDLGVSLPVGGVNASTTTTGILNHEYISESTTLASLNGGRGVGTGTVRILGPGGATKDVVIGSGVLTVGDFIQQINAGSNIGVRARINDTGNGVIIEKDPSYVGADQAIVVSDVSGAVAKGLNLAGTASGTGASNAIDGSFRVSVAVAATDTLDQIVTKINAARPGVGASVVTDGSSGAPYRLKLTASNSGDNGRFQITSAGVDLGTTTVSTGNDARVFYGSDDPATAILIKRPSNSIDGVIDGLHADIHSVSATPVTLTVALDTSSAVQGIQDFVTAFNTLSSKINDDTAYNADTQQRGVLLGDSTALSLRNDLFNVLQGPAQGVSGRYQYLAQVGLSINQDGTIAIDSDKLNTAIQTDPQSVQDLFSAFTQVPGSATTSPSAGITVNNPNAQPTFTQLGVFERIGQLATKYVDSVSGILTNRSSNIDAQIAADNDSVADFDARIAAKRTLLENQFAAMESTLAQLQAQQSSLASIKPVS